MGIFSFANFNIEVVLNHTTFYPGNVIEGHVSVDVKKATKVRAVRLHIRGKEKYSYSGSCKGDDTTKSGSSRGKLDKRFLDVTITLAGNPVGTSGSFEMPVGTWTYPFTYEIPSGVPPSYVWKSSKAVEATILYDVVGLVDIPWGSNAVGKEPFTVLTCLPLAHWQLGSKEDRATHTKALKWWKVFPNGTRVVQMTLSRSVVLLGQDTAQLHVQVDHMNSSAPLEETPLVRLIQVHTCSGKRVDERCLARLQPSWSRSATSMSMTHTLDFSDKMLPTVCAPNLRVAYYVEVRMSSASNAVLPLTLVHGVDPTNSIVMATGTLVPIVQQYTYEVPTSKREAHFAMPFGAEVVEGIPVYHGPDIGAGTVPQRPDPSWETSDFVAEQLAEAKAPPEVVSDNNSFDNDNNDNASYGVASSQNSNNEVHAAPETMTFVSPSKAEL
eukprot:PhM_4_TR10958/c1_g1_i1/m.17790